MRKAIIVFLVFFLQSCVGMITNHPLSQLYRNQEKYDVINSLGKPFEKKLYYGNEILVYYVHSSVFDFFLSRKEFPFIGPYPFNKTGQEFWIIFSNDRIDAFGYAKDFKNYIKFNSEYNVLLK